MWSIFKKYELGTSLIPQKYREMIGLAVAAAIKCPYCETYHKNAAKMFRATDEELDEAALLIGQTVFWSAILHAHNYNTFVKELQVSSFLKKKIPILFL